MNNTTQETILKIMIIIEDVKKGTRPLFIINSAKLKIYINKLRY